MLGLFKGACSCEADEAEKKEKTRLARPDAFTCEQSLCRVEIRLGSASGAL